MINTIIFIVYNKILETYIATQKKITDYNFGLTALIYDWLDGFDNC